MQLQTFTSNNEVIAKALKGVKNTVYKYLNLNFKKRHYCQFNHISVQIRLIAFGHSEPEQVVSALPVYI